MKASITNSFYPINSTNNVLTFSIDGGADVNYTFPPGYYSAATMGALIQDAVTQEIGGGAGAALFTVVFNSGTGLYQVTLDDNSTPQNTTVTLKASSTIGYYIGLTSDIILTIATGPPVVSQDSAAFQALPHLSGPIVYQIRTNIVSPNVWTKEESSYSSILAVIPIAGGPFDTTIYNPVNMELNEFFSPITSMNIIITDENGVQIDFNGQSNDLLLGVYLADM
jgi:hypothetical protein